MVAGRQLLLATAVAVAGCSFSLSAPATDDDASPGDARAGDADESAPDVNPPITGALSGSGVLLTSGVFDLTTEGTLDWAEWGMTSTSDFIRKASGGGLIPNVTMINGTSYTGYGNSYMQAGFVGFTWSDGSPTLSSGPAQYSGIYVAGNARGLRIEVPASTSDRTLRLYVGVYQSKGRLTAQLSDASAPDYVDSNYGNSPSTNYAGVYTLVFRSPTPNAVLSVSWVQTQAGGDVNWSAATLQ